VASKIRDSEPTDLLAASASSTTPLLLELTRQQASRRRPADLIAQYARDGFVVPSFLDQRLLNQLDALALAAAPSHEALQLAPVAPLGACSVVAPTSQHRTLSTTRGSEVVSDPTNVLALECAKRIRAGSNPSIQLCTVHQVLRAQPFNDKPGHSQHFRMFALADGGLGRADDGFEVDAVASQLAVFDHLFDALTNELGCHFPRRRAVLRTNPICETLAQRIERRLGETLPHIELRREPLDSAYYDGVRVMFGADSIHGEWIPIGDLGRFDWLAKLTSNRRQRFVAAGFGLQLAPVLFRPSVYTAQQ
jgi:hypothetical protein